MSPANEITLIFLAAGRGSRMQELTAETPKALLALPDGSSILGKNLSAAAALWPGLRVLVVAGYQAGKIRDFVRSFSTDLRISIIENPDYDRAGPLRSIALALAAAETEHLVVANGDTVFDPQMLRRCVTSGTTDDIYLFASDRPPASDDIAASISPSGKITEAGKKIDAARPVVSAGMVVIRGAAAVARFSQAVQSGLAEEARQGMPIVWHSVFSFLNTQGQPAGIELVPGKWWHEFDTQEHLAALR